MFQIDPMSRKPVYEQLIDSVERYVLAGILAEGALMPSVRSLSAELSVNPNTILKAYSELDSRKVIHSVPGRGYFVCDGAVAAISGHKLARMSELSQLASEFAAAGIPVDTVIACVNEAYGRAAHTETNTNGRITDDKG